MLNEVIMNIGLLFALIGVGYFIKVKEESLDDIAHIVVDICLPALIFYSTMTTVSKEMLGSLLYTMGMGVVTSLVGLLSGWIVFTLLKLDKKNKGTFLLTCSFGNTGYIGMPLGMALFGREGLVLAVSFDFGMNLILWTLGLGMLEREAGNDHGNLLKKFMNPLIIAMFTGSIIGFSEIQIPFGVDKFFNLLGSIAPVLAMLFVGMRLRKLSYNPKEYWRDIMGITAVKLLIIPLVVLGILQIIQVEDITFIIILLQSAMPTMASAPIVVSRFNNNSSYAAVGVLVSTLLCGITIPIFIKVIYG